jgi:hypothetical protein
LFETLLALGHAVPVLYWCAVVGFETLLALGHAVPVRSVKSLVSSNGIVCHVVQYQDPIAGWHVCETSIC